MYLTMFIPPKELPKQYFASFISVGLRTVLFPKAREHIIRVTKEVTHGIGRSKPNSGPYLRIMEIQFPWYCCSRLLGIFSICIGSVGDINNPS